MTAPEWQPCNHLAAYLSNFFRKLFYDLAVNGYIVQIRAPTCFIAYATGMILQALIHRSQRSRGTVIFHGTQYTVACPIDLKDIIIGAFDWLVFCKTPDFIHQLFRPRQVSLSQAHSSQASFIFQHLDFIP